MEFFWFVMLMNLGLLLLNDLDCHTFCDVDTIDGCEVGLSSRRLDLESNLFNGCVNLLVISPLKLFFFSLMNGCC